MAVNITNVMINTAYGRPCGNYSIEDANTVIRTEFEKRLGIPAGCKDRKIIKRALRRNKPEFFEIVEDTIQDMLVSGWTDNEFFERFVEFKNLELGDENHFFVEDDCILTVDEIAEGNNDLRRQKLGTGSEFSVKTRLFGIRVYEEYIRFQTGASDWAKFTQKMYEAFDKNVNDKIFNAFMAIENSVPAGFHLTGTLNRDTLIELLEKVETATGQEVIIAGTKPALSKVANLTPAGWVSDKMRDERNTTGEIAMFEGYEMLRVPNVFEKGTTTFKYSNNKIYILPKTEVKPIKFVYEGDMTYDENTDRKNNMDQTIEADLTFRAGIATIFGQYYGVCTW